jgi:putative hemolysin
MEGGSPGRIDLRALFMAKNPRVAERIPAFGYALLEKIAHQRELNDGIERLSGFEGRDFIREALATLDIKTVVKGAHRIPRDGRLTFCANHPLGGADGLALMSLVYGVRDDFLWPTNDLVMTIPQLASHAVAINKHGGNQGLAQAFDAMYGSDKAVMVFPAGRTSRPRRGRLVEFPWAKGFVKKSRQHGRLIVPVHVSGRNSALFYDIWRARRALGIRPNLEMFLLVDELMKQRGSTLELRVGQVLDPSGWLPAEDQNAADALCAYVDALGLDENAAFEGDKHG